MTPMCTNHNNALQSLLGKRSRSDIDDDDYPQLTKAWRVEPDLALPTTRSAFDLASLDSTSIFDFSLPSISSPPDAAYTRVGKPVLDSSTTPRMASTEQLQRALGRAETQRNPSYGGPSGFGASEQVGIPSEDVERDSSNLPTNDEFQARALSSSSISDIRAKRRVRKKTKAAPVITPYFNTLQPSVKRTKDGERQNRLPSGGLAGTTHDLGNTAPNDYQIMLLNLERNNKLRLLTARQEVETANLKYSEQNANKTSAEIEKERHGLPGSRLLQMGGLKVFDVDNAIYMKDTISQDLTTDNVLNRLRDVRVRELSERRIKGILL